MIAEPKNKLNAANEVRSTLKEAESELHTKSVNSINKLDWLISINKNKYK